MTTTQAPLPRRRPTVRIRLDDADASQAGFTLVEILVVVIIIGMLAAIAVPVFLGQRRKAIDATVKSDLSTTALSFEAFRTNSSDYPGTSSDIASDVTVTPGTSIAVYRDAESYCLVGTRHSGTQPTHPWVYVSDAGGLQDASVTTCAGTSDFTLP